MEGRSESTAVAALLVRQFRDGPDNLNRSAWLDCCREKFPSLALPPGCVSGVFTDFSVFGGGQSDVQDGLGIVLLGRDR